jgi:hypothetical protein
MNAISLAHTWFMRNYPDSWSFAHEIEFDCVLFLSILHTYDETTTLKLFRRARS